MKEHIKKEIGITLVALVITIIVLLILAGVSIAMLTGKSGILGNSQKAIAKSENAQIQENATLADYENEISGIIGNRNVSEERIRELIKEELANKYFPTYPTGKPQVIASNNSIMDNEATITAPGDGWVVIRANTNSTKGVHCVLRSGNLSHTATDGAVWLQLCASLPCKEGGTIAYRWWGNGCIGGTITFIPQE